MRKVVRPSGEGQGLPTLDLLAGAEGVADFVEHESGKQTRRRTQWDDMKAWPGIHHMKQPTVEALRCMHCAMRER